jgi:hypothetical protein
MKNVTAEFAENAEDYIFFGQAQGIHLWVIGSKRCPAKSVEAIRCHPERRRNLSALSAVNCYLKMLSSCPLKDFEGFSGRPPDPNRKTGRIPHA